MFGDLLELWLLFLTAFMAATILPAQSEILLILYEKQNLFSSSILVITATLGNVLGSFVNWALGRSFIKLRHKKWFPVKEKMLKRASAIYEKYGVWSLLFAWLPVIGDPLTLIAGIFKTKIWIFLLLVTIGKALRYIAIVWAF